ncbi:hypothetical protein C3E98_042910, partial [Pseudomonas sp. MWU13-2625]
GPFLSFASSAFLLYCRPGCPAADPIQFMTWRAAAMESQENNVEPSQIRKPRVGVLTRVLQDAACYKLRLGDPLCLMSPVLEAYHFKNQADHSYEGVYPFKEDRDFVDAMDMFIVQRLFPYPEFRPLLEMIVASGKPIVYEVDDWLLDMSEQH